MECGESGSVIRAKGEGAKGEGMSGRTLAQARFFSRGRTLLIWKSVPEKVSRLRVGICPEDHAVCLCDRSAMRVVFVRAIEVQQANLGVCLQIMFHRGFPPTCRLTVDYARTHFFRRAAVSFDFVRVSLRSSFNSTVPSATAFCFIKRS